jgi:bacterioferritin
MKGSPAVVDQLAKLLRGELAARDQYFTHARVYEDLGLQKLYEHAIHEMEHETQHADAIMARMLFLEAKPDLSQKAPMKIGSDVPSMLQADLDMEYQVVADLREAMAVCEAEQDYVTRDMLLQQLDDTEMDHAHWLEQQLAQIRLMGLANYLQSQVTGSAG